MAAKSILVLGANGFLGTSLVKHLRLNPGMNVITHSQTGMADERCSLTDYGSVSSLLNRLNPDFCVNLVALTDVNKCESEHSKAMALNIEPVRNIVKCILSEKFALKLIHISTDHVYDAANSSEEDIKILNYYALTKFVADEVAKSVPAAVLRTNFFGQSAVAKQSFSDWVIQSAIAKKRISGFSDVYFSPLHISTLVYEIERVINSFLPGVFNLGSNQGMSKYDFIMNLCRFKNLNTDCIAPCLYEDAEMIVPRPRDMRMNVSKYEKAFGICLPNLEEEIMKC